MHNPVQDGILLGWLGEESVPLIRQELTRDQ